MVLLLVVLYSNPEFLQKFSNNILGKAVLLVAVLSLTLHNTCMGFLAGLVFIILLKTHRENFEGEEEDEDEDDEEEEEEEKEGVEIAQENVKTLEKEPIQGFERKNAEQMKKISEQLMGVMDGLAAENQVRPKQSSSTVLDLYKEKHGKL
tara:strand:+ start:492 stop:941 length:450 start_codon:yes stop_codon:yes gene_type:complete